MTGILMSVMIRSMPPRFDDLERLAAVLGDEHLVAVHLQHAGEQLLDALLVVDDEDAAAFADGRGRGLGFAARGRARRRRR